MDILLGMIALAGAAAACVAAWRAHRASHRLALEMVQLRDRLTRAEAARDDAEARARHAAPAETVDSHLRERLESVEARLRDALEREVEVDIEDEHGLREEIGRQLRREGYHRIAFLESGSDGSVLVEAERQGTTAKGRAEIGADGRVRLRSVSSVRAFP